MSRSVDPSAATPSWILIDAVDCRGVWSALQLLGLHYLFYFIPGFGKTTTFGGNPGGRTGFSARILLLPLSRVNAALVTDVWLVWSIAATAATEWPAGYPVSAFGLPVFISNINIRFNTNTGRVVVARSGVARSGVGRDIPRPDVGDFYSFFRRRSRSCCCCCRCCGC